MFDHGVDVEAVYWHQVQVTELVRSGGDAQGEGILRVHKQDAGRPVPSLDQGQEVLRIIGGQIETVDYVEIILRYMKSYFHLSESIPSHARTCANLTLRVCVSPYTLMW